MIYLTDVKQPVVGALILCRCDECKTITFVHSDYAPKPIDGGDFWRMHFCTDVPAHNMPKVDELLFDFKKLRGL